MPPALFAPALLLAPGGSVGACRARPHEAGRRNADEVDCCDLPGVPAIDFSRF